VGWVGAAVAAVVVGAMIFVYGVPFRNSLSPVSVAASSAVNGAISVDPAAPVRLEFTKPMDHTAVEKAVRMTPAATWSPAWQGNTLTVTPKNGFAPNAAYVLTIDRNLARTATGARLATDLHVVFGTALLAGLGPAPTTTVALTRTPVADAAKDSEAIVARDGSVLLTAAQSGPATNYSSGLVRVNGGNATRLSGATDAICLSRSANAIAFLTRDGSSSKVVFADSVGTVQQGVSVAVDQGSPLGWIGEKVSYVGGGRLRAVDRNGNSTQLYDAPVNAASDTIAISPGGRYVYLQPAGSPASAGRLIDLQTKQSHPLPGITAGPAFSADGATVVWIDADGGTPRLAVAASGGGPVLTAPLPVKAGDTISDLSVSPDGSWFVYSVTGQDHRAELRLASLPDGHTLAVSTAGVGQSPNWSPSGRLFTVLGSGNGGPRIETVTVPDPVSDPQASFEATATAFANAQIGNDQGAQRALAAANITLPDLPSHVTRSAVLWVLRSPDGTATARVRLTIDAQPGSPLATQAEETLTLGPRTSTAPSTVRSVSAVPAFSPAPTGPQLVHLDNDATPGALALAFDSDLDPGSLAAIELTTSDGARVPANPSYDAATRTVTLHPLAHSGATVVVKIGTGLRDTSGHAPSAEVTVTTPLGG
jgi:hypothetical protein